MSNDTQPEIIPLVDLKAQYRNIKNEVDAAMLSTAERASFIKGPDHEPFAEEFASFCGGGHTALCGNGTDALYLALYETVGHGDGSEEIITTTHTFIATAEAIVRAGYKPVFVDIDPASYLLDVDQVEKAIGLKTKAIIPVHLYGRMAPMDRLMAVADKHGLTVIEDAAQAHGALYKGKGPGKWGAAACFSFFPGKNLGAYGDGGAVFSEDETLVERIRSFANHGRDTKYLHDRYGVNSRLDGMQASVLRAKLPHLAGWTRQRQNVAALYDELLSGVDGIVCPETDADTNHVYHLYVIRVNDAETRERVLEGLKSEGVMAGIHYPVPLHEQPAFAHMAHAPEDFPVAHAAAQRIISLPLYPEISEAQVRRVAETLKRLVAKVQA
ncbi:aminotransferase class I/II-fold pyridoxal phosphate-dependent enzyme [Pseudodesulfovibrio cashew]|uniref:Aminotransferase class I/II-fold pyridoxal phosphate-dependent enzyme n=1 Tax=Pseudodesulfovibrio cashew TaxID=2678688 RepID=A0A6I6JBA4_9BACT|nr:DegT/DnrJ/EryC1/StrS family aminotransferase [Pseudodesulfovibrio cashew]QGY39351.1 aminotransferase class I/II-fold pyridoxal phosphate-dependent enzyme [Pseudodesulfovibrio cashew]